MQGLHCYLPAVAESHPALSRSNYMLASKCCWVTSAVWTGDLHSDIRKISLFNSKKKKPNQGAAPEEQSLEGVKISTGNGQGNLYEEPAPRSCWEKVRRSQIPRRQRWPETRPGRWRGRHRSSSSSSLLLYCCGAPKRGAGPGEPAPTTAGTATRQHRAPNTVTASAGVRGPSCRESGLCLNSSFLLFFSCRSFQLATGTAVRGWGPSLRRRSRSCKASCWVGSLFGLGGFVFLTLHCKGRYSRNSVLAHALRSSQEIAPAPAASKARSMCYLLPPPPKEIHALLTAFLFSNGRVYTL